MAKVICGCTRTEKNSGAHVGGGREKVIRRDELLRLVSNAGLPGALMAGCVFEDISKEIRQVGGRINSSVN